MGEKKHLNKTPPKIPRQSRENFVYVFFFFMCFFSLPTLLPVAAWLAITEKKTPVLGHCWLASRPVKHGISTLPNLGKEEMKNATSGLRIKKPWLVVIYVMFFCSWLQSLACDSGN